jgi:S-adenosylmethionine:tRNA ribosyltransferase-isomerase
MRLSEFDYKLPTELIAQEPQAERDRSRMLVVDRQSGIRHDSSFAEFPTFFGAGDLIVINNTRVFPARLIGRRILPRAQPLSLPRAQPRNLPRNPKDEPAGQKGARVEVFLIRPVGSGKNEWEVLAKPGRAMRVGAELVFGNGRLHGVVTGLLEEGRRQIRFACNEDFDRIVDEIGNTPLPPYIKREHSEDLRLDEPRYQTVYAKERGAIAAPTAGLHFTPQIFAELSARSVQIVEITHHVGYATFQPLRVEQIEEHQILAESYEITAQAAQAINIAKQKGKRITAIGTTTVRALESAAGPHGQIRTGRDKTELYIYPGYKFRVIDGLLTNFHLPQSSLLVLVSAFAGHDLIMKAYRHAVAEKYRFYSYGDCMLLI